ncbi:MAG: type II secretion system F family protein [Erysipelotrichaceae bacterium]|nr:type II secretion system F family protein [Erysipelotrichaceae bacterium]MDY5252302.1 type II secretion system F family protein [Erysipelotrichaceae bacterium]
MKRWKINWLKAITTKSEGHLKEFDLIAIDKLLNSGFAFKDCLELLKNKQNEKIFDEIDERLQQGEMIEDFFKNYLTAQYASYFTSLIRFEAFNTSLSLMNEMVSSDNKQKQLYLKNLTYPAAIFIATILGIYFFNLWVFPSLLGVMASFAKANSLVLGMQKAISWLTNCFLFLMIFVLAVILYYKQPAKQVKGFLLYQRIFSQGFWQDFVTNDFVRFFYHCQKRGLSTQQSMKVMENLHHQPLVAFVATCIDKQLQQGEMFEKAMNLYFLDKTLYKFMVIAVNTSKIDEMLKGYMELNALKVEKQCQRISRSLQLFAYSLMGIMLVYVYQILLMPLGMIAQL